MHRSARMGQFYQAQDIYSSSTYRMGPGQVVHNNDNSRNQNNPTGKQKTSKIKEYQSTRQLQPFPAQDFYPASSVQILNKSSEDEEQVAHRQAVHNNHSSRNQNNLTGNQSRGQSSKSGYVRPTSQQLRSLSERFKNKEQVAPGQVERDNNDSTTQNNPNGNQISSQPSIVIDGGTIKVFILVCVLTFVLRFTGKF